MRKRGAGKAPCTTQRRSPNWMTEALEPRRLLSAHSVTPAVAANSPTHQLPGYTPSQILHAYGFDTLAATAGAVGGDGSGQTIAIVEAYHDPTLAADLTTFDQQFGIAAPPSLTEINQTGGQKLPGVNATWSTETALDVEWAHAVAPGANILVVEARSRSLSDLLAAVDAARKFSNVSVVSMSWGVSEFAAETSFDNLFTTPSGHVNETFVGSSGDALVASGVQWPASSPNVVSVGGSTLTVTPSGTSTETTLASAASSASTYEAGPVFQTVTNSTSSSRTTPDVVYDASVSPGFSVYDSGSGGWINVGGTSAGAPQWAALVAIANQVRASAGASSLDGASQTLPTLANLSMMVQVTTNSSVNDVNTTISSATTGTSTGSTLSGAVTVDSTAPGRASVVSSNTAIAPVSLKSADGTPQAATVISALVHAAATAPVTSGSDPLGSKSAAAKLRGRTAKPFVLNPMPVRLAPMMLPAPHGQLSAVMSSAAPLTQASSSAIGPVATMRGSTAPAGPSTLAQAVLQFSLNTIALVEPAAGLSSLFFGPIPVLGGIDVVPVGTEAPISQAAARSWYIAHVDVGRVFSDSLSAFIDQSMRPLQRHALGHPPRNHSLAWSATAAVVLLDAAVLGYLFHRRRQRIAAGTYVRWWDEPKKDSGK